MLRRRVWAGVGGLAQHRFGAAGLAGAQRLHDIFVVLLGALQEGQLQRARLPPNRQGGGAGHRRAGDVLQRRGQGGVVGGGDQLAVKACVQLDPGRQREGRVAQALLGAGQQLRTFGHAVL